MVQLTENDMMEFDVIGIDASIANAFRRILLAEVMELYGALHLDYDSSMDCVVGANNGYRKGFHVQQYFCHTR